MYQVPTYAVWNPEEQVDSCATMFLLCISSFFHNLLISLEYWVKIDIALCCGNKQY